MKIEYKLIYVDMLKYGAKIKPESKTFRVIRFKGFSRRFALGNGAISLISYEPVTYRRLFISHLDP